MRADRRAALPAAPGLAGMAGLPASAGVASGGLWLAGGLSAAVHLALAGWVAATGLFSHVETSAAPAGPRVEILSVAAFDAMQSKAPVIEMAVPKQPSAPLPIPEAAKGAADSQTPNPLTRQAAILAAPSDDAGPALHRDAPAPPNPPAPVVEPVAEPLEEPEADAGALRDATMDPERSTEPEPAEEPAEEARPADPGPVQPAAPQVTARTPGGQGKAQGAGKAEASLMSDWGGRIRSKIDRAKTYPRPERSAGVTGTVTLKLTVARSGQVVGVAVAKGSGSAALDAAAVSAVKRAGRLPKAPAGLDQDSYSFSLPVAFTR
ncbi:MAG: hypothetical protein RLZZ528_2895 [Pseudomonadota bacterium]|jgi:protein TonB